MHSFKDLDQKKFYQLLKIVQQGYVAPSTFGIHLEELGTIPKAQHTMTKNFRLSTQPGGLVIVWPPPHATVC
jgi:hypothetical protein